MPNSKQIVYLSQAQYAELITNGTITVDGVTVTYDENDIYVTPQAEPVTDVRVAETSVAANGVANVSIGNGLYFSNGTLDVTPANSTQIKQSIVTNRPIAPYTQNASTFYGLAKAAGYDERNSTFPVGQYTESAKSAIHTMLSGSVSVTGSTPTITALPGIQYICGEVVTLDITLPASGIVDVVFESGSTPTVLAITPPTGYTKSWDGDFDENALKANTVYEINIAMIGDKCLGVAASWT